MFVEKVKSEGLAHLSYVVGSAGSAAVVDPRRDYDVYVDIALRHDCRITHVFETHRNEDLVSGAARLADATGARVYHGPKAAGNVAYAETASDGEEYPIGNLRLRVLETPGHTDDSLTFVLIDTESGEDAVAAFTGDTLFVGDVGRTDFYPERAREVAGQLYDSLDRILSLGDHVIIYPAHGAGSVCGSGMAAREFSTVGYERRNNPRLQIRDREAFVETKLAESHDYPPYFERMEALNLTGAPEIAVPVEPPPLRAGQVENLVARATLVDVRSTSSFLGAHLPGSVSLPLDTIPGFAGWLLKPDDELILVADDAGDAKRAALYFARIGFDRIIGFLAPSLTEWAAAGGAFNTLPVVTHADVRRRIEAGGDNWTLLDVRADDELAEERIADAEHVYIGELPGKIDELDRDQSYTVMCASGARATIAASVLLRRGFDRVDLFLGSLGAWKSQGYETVD